ncbi:MAG: oxalate/formate MFS antiporter [Geminicoccaceae bacterium]|nr:oxalate/formate MFS antiporter [Geminicoccaceae bacterium]
MARVISTPARPGGVSDGYRWTQLALGVVCMVMIANLQYGWTLFVLPIDNSYHWGKAAIQVAFTIFVLAETWLVPIEGYLVDRFGPAPVVLVGGLLVGISWVMNSYVDSLAMLYVAAAIGGIGAGAVYGTCVGNAIKWFPDKRGLAAGITAAGFGMGSALTVVPIANMIGSVGWQQTFFVFGLGQGIIILLVGFFLSDPKRQGVVLQGSTRLRQSKRDYTPKEVLRSPLFWVMYAMFVMMAAGGLMATAELAPIAKDWGVGDIPVTLVGITLPALTFALTIDRVLNGLTRPFFGWVSDKIGRENTMFVAFGLEAIGIVVLYYYGPTGPLAFMVLTGIVFFAWGEIYSLFPATCGDAYGSRYAATNAGLLYTAKGTASLVVPIASVVQASTGTWEAVFWLAAIMNAVAAIMALVVLKPMLARHAAASEVSPAAVDEGVVMGGGPYSPVA